MKTFSFNLDTVKYTVKIKPNGSPSNYNRMITVFEHGDNMPLIGFACKETDGKEYIATKAIASIKRAQQTKNIL